MGRDLISRLVKPFYLSMMRYNAAEVPADLIDRVVGVGSESTPEDVIELLAKPWRGTVMGAWLSLFHDASSVGQPLLAALDASVGSLDAPPLAVTAVVLLGPGAAPSLNAYVRRDVASGWGAAGLVSAAISYLGEPSEPPPSAEDIETFDRLLAVAHLLRPST